MIGNLQPGEIVVAERIDRISRLHLAEAEPKGLWPQYASKVPGSRCPALSI
jgi:hypothetical protein